MLMALLVIEKLIQVNMTNSLLACLDIMLDLKFQLCTPLLRFPFCLALCLEMLATARL